MSAEAIARLREKLVKAESEDRLAPVFVYGVTVDDLRALLDAHAALETAHAEALDALRGLEDACASVASWSEECLDFSDSRRIAARTVLAKAGRR